MKNAHVHLFAVLLLLYFTTRTFSVEEKDIHDDIIMNRSKRQLLWPNTTLLQFNIGLATPTPVKTVMVNWAFQANFQLPWNRSQIPMDILHADSAYDGDSRSQRDANSNNMPVKGTIEDETHATEHVSNSNTDEYMREAFKNTRSKYDNGPAGKVKEMRNNLEESGGQYESDTGLYHFYNYVADMLNGFGYNGTGCVLQVLCQLAAEPLHTDDEEDLLHEVVSFVLNPNNDLEDSPLPRDHEAHQFIDAHNQGLAGGDCQAHHPCSLNLLDMFTVIRG